MTTTFSVDYFREEVIRFRKLMGEKSFWSDPEKAGRAMSGLLFVWCNTDNPSEQDISLMQATTIEYDRRLQFAIFHN